MIGKIDGKVTHAVPSFGGFLGIGDDHYPLPWQSLEYNTDLAGYQTSLIEDELRGAPNYANESDWPWDESRNRSVNEYYGRSGLIAFGAGCAREHPRPLEHDSILTSVWRDRVRRSIRFYVLS
jgi:hypothetical protein